MSVDDTRSSILKKDLNTDIVQSVLKTDRYITSISVSEKGIVIYTTNDGALRIFDTKSHIHQSLETHGRVHDPKFSPHGDGLVYCLENSSYADDWDLWIYDFQRGKNELLHDDEYLNRNPVFTEDGDSVFFFAGRGRNTTLYVIDVLTRAKHTIMTDSGYFDFESAISPDETKIAFSSNRTRDFDIWILNLATNKIEQITDEKGFEGRPIWLSNHEIIYEANHPDHWGIWRLDLESNSKELVSPKGVKCRYPAIGY